MSKYGKTTIYNVDIEPIDVEVDIEDVVDSEYDTVIRILENEYGCIITYEDDLPKRSLIEQMKYDYFMENFNNITLEDLEDIVNGWNSDN